MPRSGGIFIFISIFLPWIPFKIYLISSIIYAVSLIFVISLLDDIKDINPVYRITIHLLSAILFLYLSSFDLSTFQFFLLTILLIYSSNIYNFMDGADGLASGFAFIGFGFYGIYALINDALFFSLFNFSISLSCLAFLFFNYQPAKIFMGDSGSVTLGFLASSIGIYGWQQSIWEYYYPFLVFSLFFLDSTFTLLNRIIRKKSIFLAHKEHIYQKLITCGFSHKKTMSQYLICSFVINLVIILTILSKSDNLLIIFSILVIALCVFFYKLVSIKFNQLGK